MTVLVLTLTVVCLEGLGLDYLTAVAAHHQVEVILCRTLAKYWHVCIREERATRQDTSQFEAMGNLRSSVAKVNSTRQEKEHWLCHG